MKLLSIPMLLLITGVTWAADGIRIGYVDIQRLLDDAPQMQAGREHLDRDFRPRNNEILADEARLARLEQEYTQTTGLNEDQRLDLEREIRNLARSIERRREDLRDEFQYQRNAKVKELEEEIDLTVRTVATEHGYDLVLTSPVAFASDSIDITELVLEALKRDFENQQP